MKLLKHLSLITLVLIGFSCSNSTSKQAANKEGFIAIEEALKEKFGANAYYTDISITYNAAIGNIIGVTVTEDPESLKMGQFNLTQDNWTQNQDITVEVPSGTKAADYMFQLGDKISLSELGHLVETSSKKLKDEKNIENAVLSIASIQFPNTGDFSKASYLINLQPEQGGTTFSFQYALNGTLLNQDY